MKEESCARSAGGGDRGTFACGGLLGAPREHQVRGGWTGSGGREVVVWPQDAAAGCILRRQASWGVARESGQMVHAQERLCGWTLREEARGRGAVPDWVGARWEENCSAQSNSAVGAREAAEEGVGARGGADGTRG